MEGALNVQPELARALATALLHSLWQCALLAVAAAAALQALKRYGAALRHNVGMVFLLAMAGAPVWTFVTYWLQSADKAEPWRAPVEMAPEAGIAPGMLIPPASAWPTLLCALWLFGVLCMLVRRLGGLWWIGQLERHDAGRLPAEWQSRLDVLQRMMGVTRKIVVRVSEAVVVPFTLRLFQPVIWMPLSVFCQMSREQVEALFAHELAHIQRLDWLWNGLQCVVEALLFFHPGVWWLSRRVRDERELACDDAAVNACTDAIVLSEALAALARGQLSGRQLLLAANGGPLMTRIAHLLSGAPAPTRSGIALAVVAFAAAGAVLAAPLGAGYAAQVHASEPVGSVSNPSDLYSGLIVSPGAAERAAARDPMQAAHDGVVRTEEAARNIEAAVRGGEGLARDAQEASRAWEQNGRDAEEAARDQATQALRAERAVQAMDTERSPHVDRPVVVAPGFSGRTGFAPVNAEVAATPLGQASDALVRLVAADPRVTSMLGNSVVVTSDGFTGSWRLDEEAGVYTEVRLSFTLTGSQGRARIWASAVQGGGQWRLTGLEVREFTPLRR